MRLVPSTIGFSPRGHIWLPLALRANVSERLMAQMG